MSVPYSLASSVYKTGCPKCGAASGKLCVRLKKNQHSSLGVKLPELSQAHIERWRALQPQLPLDNPEPVAYKGVP